MTRDNKPKPKYNTRQKKVADKKEKKKQNEESSDSDYNDDDEDEDENEELDMQEYRKFLAKTFPSKNANDKVKAGEKLDKALKDDNKKNNTKSKSSTSPVSKGKSKGKKEIESDEEDENDESDSEYLDEDDDTEDDDEEDDDIEEDVQKKPSKFNIIFTIGEKAYDDEDEGEWDTCSEDCLLNDDTENEDDPISLSDDEKENKKEREKEKDKDNKSPKKKDLKPETKTETKTESESNLKESDPNVLSLLKDLQSKNKNDHLVTECIKMCEEKMKKNKENQEKIQKKTKERNERIFRRILRDKNTLNDFDFFEKLEIDQQKKIIKELREINKLTRIEKPYRLTLLESDIPIALKSAAMKKIATLRYMEPGSGEFYKIKNWVDTFMRLPFNNYKSLPITIDNGVEACHEFMADAQKTLNEAVYGMNDAKMQIMQMLGQLLTNPKAIGTAIAIHGPAGTGKTSIVKEGISKILNRPFAFIALGGATDSSFLEGHGYTYEGSTWGKIVQILIDSKCMNPVIYFDELDKISDTPKGEEITGILTHLTDTSQNSQFHDKYFTEIDFDLSKCLFIFSYNDESKVNPILRDRMYRIQTKGYNQKQKTVIANDYLLPKIREQVRFEKSDIIIPDDVIQYIVENCCSKEDGVRNLKRCLEIIHTKLNLYRLMKPGSNLFEEDMSLKVEFPFTVTKAIVDKLIKNAKDSVMMSGLYV
jgi:ATP-dependent Lon protease